MKKAIKFYTFLNRNPDVPFPIKKQIAEACVFSSIIYSTETWFTDYFGKAESLYNKIIKVLLDFRHTTCNDVCLMESAMPSLQTVIKNKMKKYLQTKLLTLTLDCQHPLWKAIHLNRQINTKSYKHINRMLEVRSDILKEEYESRFERLKQSSSSKRVTYCAMNPTLNLHNVYNSDTVKEYKRIEFTRYRLPSHNLRNRSVGESCKGESHLSMYSRWRARRISLHFSMRLEKKFKNEVLDWQSILRRFILRFKCRDFMRSIL